MEKREIDLEQEDKRKVSACNVSNLITTPKNIPLSLEKCSTETDLKSSFFNWLMR